MPDGFYFKVKIGSDSGRGGGKSHSHPSIPPIKYIFLKPAEV